MFGSVVNEDVEFFKSLDMAIYERFARGLVHEIQTDGVAGGSRVLDHLLGVLRVGFFFRKVRDSYATGTFAGKHDGSGSANTTITASDDGGFAL